MLQNSAFYIEWKCAKNPHVLEVLVWSCGGLWRFLTEVSVPDLDGEGSIMSQTTFVLKFSFLHCIKRCKEPPCPRSPGLELQRTLEVPEWGFGSWSWWGGVYNVPNNLYYEIQLSTLNEKVQWTPMSLKSWTGDMEDSGCSWLGFGSWSWWRGVNDVPSNLCSEIQFSTLNKKVQRTPKSSKSWSGVMEDSGGFWLRFWFLIMMGGVYIVPHKLCSKIPLSTLKKKCKEPPCPLSPGLELWRTLKVPEWCFNFSSWWGGFYNVPNNLCSKIQISTLNKKVQRSPCPWSPVLELWRTLKVPDWGFGSWSWCEGVTNVPNNLWSEIKLFT